MKRILLVAVLSFAVSPAVHAANNYTAAGCGLGTILFKGKSSKVHLILAATTNGTLGNQTFGISSETLECTSDGVVRNERQAEVYAAVNYQRLSREIAQGGGEYLDGMAALLGWLTPERKTEFARRAQSQYERVFPAGSADPGVMLAALRAL